MSSGCRPVPALFDAAGHLEKGARRMSEGYRVILFASLCLVFVLAGCVPIQPEPLVAKEQTPASSAQSSSQATPEPPATLTPEPPDPPTSAAPESPEGRPSREKRPALAA